MRKAYHKGTRSISGMPGPNYWQNRAEYVIEAELNHKESQLNGMETIWYFNNSPDTLKRIVVRLYQDIYRVGNTRDFSMGEDAVNEGMVITDFMINNKDVELENNKMIIRGATNLFVGLENALLPGDSVHFKIDWHYTISEKRPIRTGNYGGNRFFVAYWYPQIAVYDDIDGWDRIDYRGAVEYYNDFNDYDVTIRTTEGFKVWATGTLTNMDEIYDKKVVKRYKQALNSDEVVRMYSADDCKNGTVLKTDENSWNFVASHVPDFSFAATNIANWEGSSVLVEPETDRRVLVDAVYGESARTFTESAHEARNAVIYLSEDWPGYPFPYEHMTSYSNGRMGGGMETPMMANNGDPRESPRASATTFHEIAHTYFPFFMGTNERKNAWMDEGWAANLPIGFMDKYFPDHRYLERTVERFEGVNGMESEMRLMDLSYGLTGWDAYRIHAYVRPALAYHFLQDALGDSLFKVALHAYIDTWNGKHPTPFDYFNITVNASGQKLLWFFKPWFFDKAYADQGIKKVTLDNKIVVENVGGLPMRVELLCEYEDGTTEVIKESTAIWSSMAPAVVIEADGEKKIKKVTLGSERIPDINESNNVMLPEYD